MSPSNGQAHRGEGGYSLYAPVRLALRAELLSETAVLPRIRWPATVETASDADQNEATVWGSGYRYRKKITMRRRFRFPPATVPPPETTETNRSGSERRSACPVRSRMPLLTGQWGVR